MCVCLGKSSSFDERRWFFSSFHHANHHPTQQQNQIAGSQPVDGGIMILLFFLFHFVSVICGSASCAFLICRRVGSSVATTTISPFDLTQTQHIWTKLDVFLLLSFRCSGIWTPSVDPFDNSINTLVADRNASFVR